jgi:glucose uptake protein GlcU
MKLDLKNKKLVIVLIALIVIILVVLGIFLSNKNKTKNTLNNYNETMKELAKIFYEDQYYDLVVNSRGKDALAIYSERGIDVDLSDFIGCKDQNIFYSSEKFKFVVNQYYNSLSNEERKEMINDLSYSNNPWVSSQWLRI